MRSDKYLVTNEDIYNCVNSWPGDLYADPEERIWVGKTTIPQNDKCLSVSAVKNLVYLDESTLPTDGRMPTWDDLTPLVPCGTTARMDSSVNNQAYASWALGSVPGQVTVTGTRAYPTDGSDCLDKWVKFGFYQAGTLIATFTYNCVDDTASTTFDYTPNGGRVTSQIIDRYNVHAIGIGLDMTVGCPVPDSNLISVNFHLIPVGNTGFKIRVYLLDNMGAPINNPCGDFNINYSLNDGSSGTFVTLPDGQDEVETSTHSGTVYKIEPNILGPAACTYSFYRGSITGDTYELNGTVMGPDGSKYIQFNYYQFSTVTMAPCKDVAITYTVDGVQYTETFPANVSSYNTTNTFSSITTATIDSVSSSYVCLNTITLGSIELNPTYYVWVTITSGRISAYLRTEPNGGGTLVNSFCTLNISVDYVVPPSPTQYHTTFTILNAQSSGQDSHLVSGTTQLSNLYGTPTICDGSNIVYQLDPLFS